MDFDLAALLSSKQMVLSLSLVQSLE
jgi:hypothetical protein